ncbi:MAG: biotin--[acetyl-CoA-carboxylase] ligase [Marmoricola sp.]
MTEPTSPRSPLEQDALQAAAGAGWVVQLHAEATSTNAVAAAEPARDLVVVAENQTAGRGRLDRSWVTPPGTALTFSAVVEPVVEPRFWPLIPLAAGYAVARAVAAGARLKWPNDVLLPDDGVEAGQGKLCGILVERVEWKRPLAVVGIGINVDQRREELPVPTATSLALAGRTTDRAELFGQVLRELRSVLGMLAQRPSTFVAQYRGLSATLERDVRVDLPDGTALQGRAWDVDEVGRLVLAIPTDPPDPPAGPPRPASVWDHHRRVAVSAGDVVHVRPAG